jgi:hypothetical protein
VRQIALLATAPALKSGKPKDEHAAQMARSAYAVSGGRLGEQILDDGGKRHDALRDQRADPVEVRSVAVNLGSQRHHVGTRRSRCGGAGCDRRQTPAPAPDGHSLILVRSTHGTARALMHRFLAEESDFVAIRLIASTPYVFVLHSDSPAKSFGVLTVFHLEKRDQFPPTAPDRPAPRRRACEEDGRRRHGAHRLLIPALPDGYPSDPGPYPETSPKRWVYLISKFFL